jgi:hypothetical protein
MDNYWLKKHREKQVSFFLFELYPDIHSVPDIPVCTVNIIPDKSGAITLESTNSLFAKYTQFIGGQLPPNGVYTTHSNGLLWVVQQRTHPLVIRWHHYLETLRFHNVHILMAMTASNISYLRITSQNYGSLRSNYVAL